MYKIVLSVLTFGAVLSWTLTFDLDVVNNEYSENICSGMLVLVPSFNLGQFWDW